MGEHEHENVRNAEPSEEEVDSGNKVEVENPGEAPATTQDDQTQGDTQANTQQTNTQQTDGNDGNTNA